MTWDFNHGAKMKTDDLRAYIDFTLYPALIAKGAQGKYSGIPRL